VWTEIEKLAEFDPAAVARTIIVCAREHPDGIEPYSVW